MATITIKNGTPTGTDSICLRCKHVHMQRGYRETEEQIFCNFVWETLRLIPFRVRECTDFQERDVPSVADMKEIALMISPSSSAKSAGFRKNDVTQAVASTDPTK